MPFFSPHVNNFLKMRSKFFIRVFGHRSDLTGHHELQKFGFVKLIARTNEETGRVVFAPSSEQNQALFPHASLIWTLKYTKCVNLTYKCNSCSDQILPVPLNTTRLSEGNLFWGRLRKVHFVSSKGKALEELQASHRASDFDSALIFSLFIDTLFAGARHSGPSNGANHRRLQANRKNVQGRGLDGPAGRQSFHD